MITVSNLALLLNISERRFNQLLHECKEFKPLVKMRPSRGKIDEIEFFLAYIQLIEDKYKNSISNESELLREQIRLKRAQATRAEMENLDHSKRLIPYSVFIKFAELAFGNIRRKLLRSKNRWTSETFGSISLKENKIKVDQLMNNFLLEISDPEILFAENLRKNKKH